MTFGRPQNPLPRRRRRRFWPLALTLLVVLLAFGWAAAWFGVRHAAEQGLARFIEGQARRGVSVECHEPAYSGFPLAVDMACQFPRLKRDGDDFVLSAMRVSAPLWRPGTLIVQPESSLEAQIEGTGGLRAAWDRLDARLAVSPFDLPALARAPRGTTVGPLDLRIDAGTFAIERDIEDALPPVSFTSDLRLHDFAMRPPPGFDLVAHLRAHGLEGEVRALEVAPMAGGRISAIGSFAIDRDGRVSGRFELSAADLPAMARFLAAALREDPDAAKNVLQAAGLLQAAGFGTREGKLALSVQRGAVSAGIIPLGRIPPLF